MHLWAHLQGGEAMGRCPFRATRPGGCRSGDHIHEAVTASPRTRPKRSPQGHGLLPNQQRKERMRYAQFRSQGLFVGSGVVEAGCKTIIGQRLKQSGMRWTVNHANAIIALRCSQLSGRWEEFWEQRAAG